MQTSDVKPPTQIFGANNNNKSLAFLIGGIFAAFLTGLVAGIFDGLVAGFAVLVIVFMVMAISNYRAGIVVAIVLLPLSGTHILPREIFGIVGFNPLNLTLMMSLISLLLLYVFQKEKILIPRYTRYFWIYIGAMAFATFIGTFHVASIPAIYKTIPLINFDNAAGYVRDIFFKPMLILVTVFMLSIAVRNADRPSTFLFPLFFSALVLPIIAIFYITISGLSLHELASTNARAVLSVTGMHANELGLMFNMAFALALFSFFRVSSAPRKWILGIAVIILMTASVLTFSRGAFLGLLAVIGYFLYTQKKFKMMLFGVALIPIAIFLMPEAVMERATTGTKNNDVRAISAGRVDDIWLPLVPEVLTSPIIGHGLSSIMWSESVRNGTVLKVGHPHSAYLGVLLDMGFLGALVVIFFFRHMWRLFIALADGAQDPIWRGYFRGAAACILLLLVQGVTDDRFTPTFPQTFLWLSYGLAMGLVGRKDGIDSDNVSTHKR